MDISEARQLAYGWHDGQWSALYSFASTGVMHDLTECIREVVISQRQVVDAYHQDDMYERTEYVADCESLKKLENYFLALKNSSA